MAYNNLGLNSSTLNIGSNVCQMQTYLTPHCIVQIELFKISYKVNYYGNVSGVFGVLIIISHTHSLFAIQYNNRWLFWNHIWILFQKLII